MKNLKRSLTMLVMLLMMSFVLVACGNDEEKETEPATSNTAEVEDDKDAVSYAGEYVKSGEVSEVTFVVSEDGTFEMTTTGEVNQVVTGSYEVGITNSPSIIKLLLYPQKNVVDGTELEITSNEGTAVIEGDKLTLTMESEDTVFTKK